MAIITVVGPPGVGKSYISSQLHERIGERFSTLIPSPVLGKSDSLISPPFDMEMLYTWAYGAVHNLPDTEEEHLYIFDGFPLPDAWVTEAKPTWTLLEKNLEVRMSFKRAAQVILLPLSWKKWKSEAIHKHYVDSERAQRMRDNYERYLARTTIPGRRINMTSSVSNTIEEITRDLGVVID